MVPPDSTPPRWSRRPPERVGKSLRSWLLLFAATGACALGFALYSLRLQPPGPQAGTRPPVLPATAAKDESGRLVSLFFPLADGSGLATVIQKRPNCPDEAACLADLLLALGENPGAGLFPLFPLPGAPKSVWLTGPTATINFRRETIQHLSGGVQSERLVLTALVDTLAVNFPQVRQLSIQIDGIPAETLKGHVDLTTPFSTDFSLVRRPIVPSIPIKSDPP